MNRVTFQVKEFVLNSVECQRWDKLGVYFQSWITDPIGIQIRTPVWNRIGVEVLVPIRSQTQTHDGISNAVLDLRRHS